MNQTHPLNIKVGELKQASLLNSTTMSAATTDEAETTTSHSDTQLSPIPALSTSSSGPTGSVRAGVRARVDATPARTTTTKPRRSLSPPRSPAPQTIEFPASIFADMSQEDLGRIFDYMKFLFADFKFFDSLVAEKLKQAILNTCQSGIDERICSSASIIERYYQREIFNTPERKLILNQILVVFKTCYVYMISQLPSSLALRYKTVAQLLEAYPEFSDQKEEEQDLLLEFRNVVKIAMQIIPADKNKNVLIKVAERLEGADHRYVTGGGQKLAVCRRVAIYLKEGGEAAVKARAAPRRPTRPSSGAAGARAGGGSGGGGQAAGVNGTPPMGAGSEHKKRKVTITSLKKLKMLRLSSEELRALSKGPGDNFDEFTFDPQDFDVSQNSTPGSAFPLVDTAASDRFVDLMEFRSRNPHLKLDPALEAFRPVAPPVEKALAATRSGPFSPPIGTLSVAPSSQNSVYNGLNGAVAAAGLDGITPRPGKPGGVNRDISAGWDVLPDAQLSLSDAPILW